MKSMFSSLWFCLIFYACNESKSLAQSANSTSNDTLIQIINKSKKDTANINFQIKKLAKQNDLIIAFATLNYAWARKGTFYVLAYKNKEWKLYLYQSKLSSALSDSILQIDSSNLSVSSAENIKHLYTSSQLWNTNGDEKGKLCNDKKDCNITDAETWTLSVATPQNIHTTIYYAPEFFEQCCYGNLYRQRFVAIAKEIQRIANKNNPM